MTTEPQAAEGGSLLAASPKLREAPQLPSCRHWAVIGVAMLHCAAFGTAALYLPWSGYAPFAALTTGVAIGHALTAAAAFIGHARFARIWRATALLSLAWLCLLTWSVVTSAWYVARIYGALGSGIAAALLIGWCIPILFSVPFASWALATNVGSRVRRPRAPRPRSVAAGASLAALVLVALTWHKLADADTLPTINATSGERSLTALIHARFPKYDALPEPSAAPGALSLEPSACKQPVSSEQVSLFMQFHAQRGQRVLAVQRCVQADSVSRAIEIAGDLLRRQAVKAPIKLDLVTRLAPLTSSNSLLDGFKLRPGLDGVCDTARCLLGWQLLARHMLNENTPLQAVPELRMGFSTRRVREALGSDRDRDLAGLTRIVTTSLLYDNQLTQLSRMHRESQPTSEQAIMRANRLAEQHILRSLGKDGRYRYQHEPFSGESDTDGYNLPRQAGTTLVLCELGSAAAITKHARLALTQMASLERRTGEKSVLLTDANTRFASLGDQALPLIAFLACRPEIGKDFDPLIERLARTLLALQRPTGDFYPAWDLQRYEPYPGPPPLFSPGQALMALVLLEKNFAGRRGRAALELAQVRSAVGTAMRYYGEQYWDFPLGKLFYVEENWHCLAARAALTHHRVDAYERFCIEHARFKARFIVGSESPTRDMVGAFALAPLIPPPNTATAGVGEALAAAIALKKARGEATEWEAAQLEKLIGFLLRQQWDQATCFACQQPELVVGGFSDSMLTPTMRIDFTQHAWAAIQHGARELGLVAQSGSR